MPLARDIFMFFQKKSGDDLLSRSEKRTVPSALVGLTALFGMVRGVTPPLESPEVVVY
jgi:hypothetical protein